MNSSQIKLAAYKEAAHMTAEQIATAVGHMSGTIIGGAIGMGGAALLKDFVQNKIKTTAMQNAHREVLKDIDTSASFPMKDQKTKAAARLYEVSNIAPHLLLNKEFVLRLIRDKLNTGFSSADIDRLAEMEMHLAGSNIGQTPRLKVASALLGELTADLYQIKQACADMTDELGIEKDASLSTPLVNPSLGTSLKNLGAHMLAPVIFGTAFAGAKLLHDKVKEVGYKKELEKSFAHIMNSADPDQDAYIKDVDNAKKVFNTLARFAPAVALDPLAARSFVKKMTELDKNFVNIDEIKNLSEITKNLRSGGGDQSLSDKVFDAAHMGMSYGGLGNTKDMMFDIQKGVGRRVGGSMVDMPIVQTSTESIKDKK